MVLCSANAGAEVLYEFSGVAETCAVCNSHNAYDVLGFRISVEDSYHSADEDIDYWRWNFRYLTADFDRELIRPGAVLTLDDATLGMYREWDIDDFKGTPVPLTFDWLERVNLNAQRVGYEGQEIQPSTRIGVLAWGLMYSPYIHHERLFIASWPNREHGFGGEEGRITNIELEIHSVASSMGFLDTVGDWEQYTVDYTVRMIGVVPEPCSALLAAMAASWVLVRRERRMRDRIA